MYSTQPVSNLTDSFRFFGRNKIAGVLPGIIVVFLSFFVINAFMLTQTRFGKNVFAVGGNVQVATVGGTSHSGGIARFSGVPCGILIMGVIMIAAVAFDMRKNARRA